MLFRHKLGRSGFAFASATATVTGQVAPHFQRGAFAGPRRRGLFAVQADFHLDVPRVPRARQFFVFTPEVTALSGKKAMP